MLIFLCEGYSFFNKAAEWIVTFFDLSTDLRLFFVTHGNGGSGGFFLVSL